MSCKRDQYAVMGSPIDHSQSPLIHHLFAQQTQQALQYDALLVAPENFVTAVQHFHAQHGKGLNITLPLKELAWQWVPHCSERAALARAVNTIAFKPNGDIYGDNTDGIGLVRDLQHHLNIQLCTKRILIIGAGGATRGILPSLLAEKPLHVHIANRTVEKAQHLVEEFASIDTVYASGLGRALVNKQFDLIINASATGLNNTIPDLPIHVFAPRSICYDLCYGRHAQPFLHWASQHGAEQTRDGLGMLVEQAAEAFYLWRGIRPDTAPVIDQVRHVITTRK